MNHGERVNARNLLETEGREEEDIRLHRRVQRILIQSHLKPRASLTHMILHHLMLAPQAMTGVKGGRDLPKGTSLNVVKEGINGVIENERDGIRDPNVDPEGWALDYLGHVFTCMDN